MSDLDKPEVDEILQLFRDRGDSQYGNEAVTQVEHALQAAKLAMNAGADAELISAALLHDIGHLLHDLPEDAPDQGVDDRHEITGGHWLEKHFGEPVAGPVRLHVPAKRYLCAVDPDYHALLSRPSKQSLALQGGPMMLDEVTKFEKNPQFQRAVQLRRWDDEAKIPGEPCPPLEDFAPYLEIALTNAAR